MGIAVQAVDEDYVYIGRVGSFELRQAISIHVRLHGGLRVCLAKGAKSATMTYHGRDQLRIRLIAELDCSAMYMCVQVG